MNNAITDAKGRLEIARVMVDTARSAANAAAKSASRDEGNRAAQATAVKSLNNRYALDVSVGSEAASRALHEAAIASALDSKASIVRASVELDFATSRATASQRAHAEAVKTLNAAESELRAAAVAVADVEDVEIAEKVEAARVAYEALCTQLRSRVLSGFDVPINQAGRNVPKIVTDALERMPAGDLMYLPRGQPLEQCTFQDWNARIAKLMTGEQSAA
jgi:hypothetical protein